MIYDMNEILSFGSEDQEFTLLSSVLWHRVVWWNVITLSEGSSNHIVTYKSIAR
jgi:hypothetical protein